MTKRAATRTRTLLAGGLVLVLLIGAGVLAVLTLPLRASEVAAAAAADLGDGRLDSGAWTDPDAAQERFDTAIGDLATTIGRPTVSIASIGSDGADRRAVLEWTWRNHDDDVWTYTTELALHRSGLLWSARMTESSIHPELEAGDMLVTESAPGKRGRILGADGAVLVEAGEVIDVGIHPARLGEDGAETLSTLAETLDVDLEGLKTRVEDSDPEQFVPVITLRRDAYEQVKDTIRPLPGTVFATRTQPLSRAPGFAEATLGSAGRADAEDIEASGGTLTASSIVGKSGIQQTFDDRLRGRANQTVSIVPAPSGDEAGSGEDASGDEAASDPVLVHEFPQARGQDVVTTLDVDVQEAADAAAARGAEDTDRAVALVAIRPIDGHVLAVANKEAAGAAWDRALTGQYPPGSVFKVASTLALLDAGLDPSEIRACPATTTVSGKTFTNAEDAALGEVTFAEDFAQSCNTAFVSAAAEITSSDIANAAMNLGMGDYDLDVDSKMADIPIVDDPVVHAAQMIGQGEVVASPLSVAVMAASVADGNTVSPLLVLPDRRSSVREPVLDPDSVEALARLMGKAVSEGTASELADLDGPAVHGKTGTAEYGSQTPPRTHSWFAGYRGDLAVAVLVEDGGFGAEAAVPVAEDFFTALG